jgi:mRNA interferase MazF
MNNFISQLFDKSDFSSFSPNMLQDFLNWINVKFKTHSKISRPSFEEREIWWCHLGLNVGDEENGKNESFNRPVLILKKFNRNLALVAQPADKSKITNFMFKSNTKISYFLC